MPKEAVPFNVAQRSVNKSDGPASGLIVLVEDDPRMRKLYSDMLRSQGYTVITAKDGEEGLSLLFTNVPRVLILDIIMPNMDGIELCRRAREIIGPKVPILFLTALDQLEIVQVCLEAGGDDFIVKGSDLKTVAERVRYWSKAGYGRKAEKHRSKALAAVKSELSHSAGEGDAQGGLSSASDEVVAQISAFLAKARAAAGQPFGAKMEDKLFILGYAAGLVNYWSVAHAHVKSRHKDYLRAVLREANVFAANELDDWIDAVASLVEQEIFAKAVSKGTAEAVASKAKGADFVPAAMANFAADAHMQVEFGRLHDEHFAPAAAS